MRRVVVIGATSPLGRRVVEKLRADSGIGLVRGVEVRAPGRDPLPEGDDLDFVPLVPDHRLFADYLEKEGIDTVIQGDLVPDRSGLDARKGEADVIATMCLGAAIGHAGSRVRSWVLASSSAIYPIGSHAPLLQRERQERPREEETPAASIAEAEDYARDLAHRLPHVNVAILRLQQLIGPGVRGPLGSLLARSPVPTLIGFDPAIQLLHLEDAADAIGFVARSELAGVYNVASRGLIHWRDAVRAAGRASLPVLPVRVAGLEPVLERLKIPFVPAALMDLLRFGHAIDTTKIERAGWQPRYDQRDCLATFRLD